MAKYLLTFHGGSMPETDEARGQVMAAWEGWFKELGPALKDPGNPVGQSRTVSSDGAVSEGGGANPVSGYTLIEVDSIDSAVKAAKMCPVLQGGASIEVAETFDVM